MNDVKFDKDLSAKGPFGSAFVMLLLHIVVLISGGTACYYALALHSWMPVAAWALFAAALEGYWWYEHIYRGRRRP